MEWIEFISRVFKIKENALFMSYTECSAKKYTEKVRRLCERNTGPITLIFSVVESIAIQLFVIKNLLYNVF